MSTLIIFLLILSLLVFVHELGHFLVAKRSGIVVEEFAIGFPPRALKVWQEEGQITLDGQDYVIPRHLNLPHELEPGMEVCAQTAIDDQGRRVIEALSLVAPGEDNMAAPRQPGSEARLFGLFSRGQKKVAPDCPTVAVEALTRGTEYSINWIPFGGYVRMVGEEDPSAPDSFASKSKRIRLAVLVAGSGMNLVLAVIFFTLTSLVGVPEPVTGINLAGQEMPIAKTTITEVVPNTPAERAGMQAEDVIIGTTDGLEFEHMGDLVEYVQRHKGEEITLRLKRGEEIIPVSLTPRINPPEGQGSMGIGITYTDITNRIAYYPIHQAAWRGLKQTAEYVGITFYVPIAIFKNIIPAEAARPTGPVGIYQQTGSAVEAAIDMGWWFPVLWWIAVLSTAVGVANLLPIPALDGGRILFVIIEAVRGRRISPEKEGAIHFIGLALLLMLMLVITYYDVTNPIPTLDWNSIF